MMSHEKFSGAQANHELSTSRFLLKKPTAEDYEFLLALYADPEVMKYISTGVRDAKKTQESLDKFMHHWDKRGFGMWTIQSKESLEKIGYMGFRCLEGKEGVEFGGLLIKKAWGKGAATEIGQACLKHGFEQYKFKLIYSVVDPRNEASLYWIGKKLNMQRKPEKDGIFHNTMMSYFSINAEEV